MHSLFPSPAIEYVMLTGVYRKKYQETMDCQGINLMNTSYLYAQFTQTVLCAQMVQESIGPCGLSQQDAYLSLPLILE